MKTNKGYSLAELLVSLAIFSVVMLSIVTVMRNVSVSYRNENAEVQLQENSQMLLSQIEELLVDAKSVSYSDSNKTWSIVDSYDVTHKLKLDGNKVQYQYGTSAFEDLASNVKDLKIDGLQSANGDDKCTVKVEMVNTIDGNSGGHEYTYTASKDIVFRNASVEKSSVHDGSFLNGTGGPTTPPPSPDTINYKMGRYELLNLISEFDIDPSKTITISGNTSAYDFVKTDGLNSDNYMETINRITDGSTSPYLTTSDACNKATTSPFNCTITGTTSANKNITINISTPSVKLLKGAGIVYIPINAINNGTNKNYYSYIQIEGLNVRDAQEYFGKTCSGELSFDIPDEPGQADSHNSSLTGNVFNCATNWNRDGINDAYGKLYLSKADGGGMNHNCGLGYDPFSTDILGVCFAGKCFEPNATDKHDSFNGAKYKVTVSITYPSQTTTDTASQEYTVLTAGANLSNVN